jgi:hypothetical protein
LTATADAGSLPRRGKALALAQGRNEPGRPLLDAQAVKEESKDFGQPTLEERGRRQISKSRLAPWRDRMFERLDFAASARATARRQSPPNLTFVIQLLHGHPPGGAQARRRDEDIRHGTANAIAVDDQDDDTRLYLGPARDGEMLEVVTLARDDGTDLAIHAMKMRPKYQRLLPGS